MSVKNTFLDTESLDLQATPQGSRRTKSAGPGGNRGKQLSPEQAIVERLNGWDGEVFCNGYSADDRAKWLVDNCGLSLGKARLRVMYEFPSLFRYRQEPSSEQACGGNRDPEAHVAKAMQRSLHSSSLSTILEDWDAEEFCDGHCASDRAKWVVENCGLSVDDARLRIMHEFPLQFGHHKSTPSMEHLLGDVVPTTKKRTFSNSSLSTMCPEDRLADWDGEEFCEGHSADDRAKWVVENCGLSLHMARLLVMSEFPAVFGHHRYQSADDSDWERESVSTASGASVSSSSGSDFTYDRVPKVLNLAEELMKTAEALPTTMMLRNLPNRYKQQELIEELELLGFAGTFDFFYAPIDFGTMGNVGYAFINFISPDQAKRFQNEVDGYSFKKHQQKKRNKTAMVSVAHLQGLDANLRHYEKAAVTGRARSRRCGPVVMPRLLSSTAANLGLIPAF